MNTYQCTNPIVPEKAWFGQPKYSTSSKSHPTLCQEQRQEFRDVFFFTLQCSCSSGWEQITSQRCNFLTNDGVYQCVVRNKRYKPVLVSATWVHVKGTGTCNIVKFSLTDDHVKHWRNYSIIFHQTSRF